MLRRTKTSSVASTSELSTNTVEDRFEAQNLNVALNLVSSASGPQDLEELRALRQAVNLLSKVPTRELRQASRARIDKDGIQSKTTSRPSMSLKRPSFQIRRKPIQPLLEVQLEETTQRRTDAEESDETESSTKVETSTPRVSNFANKLRRKPVPSFFEGKKISAQQLLVHLQCSRLQFPLPLNLLLRS